MKYRNLYNFPDSIICLGLNIITLKQANYKTKKYNSFLNLFSFFFFLIKHISTLINYEIKQGMCFALRNF